MPFSPDYYYLFLCLTVTTLSYCIFIFRELLNRFPGRTLSMRSMKKVAVAIQIGKHDSGCAYSFRREPDRLLIPLHIEKYNRPGSHTCKLPNSILLNSHQELVAFGNDAEDKYFELVTEGKQHDWLYFKQFTKNIDKQVKF